MAAYNGVNGAPMTENDLLAEPLKASGASTAWSSPTGAALRRRAAARAALDLDDARTRREVGRAARRGGPRRAGRRGRPSTTRSAGCSGWPRGPARWRASTRGSPSRTRAGSRTPRPSPVRRPGGAVLLRNDGVLPLAIEDLRRVAVVGPGARDARALGGGSATVPLHTW